MHLFSFVRRFIHASRIGLVLSALLVMAFTSPLASAQVLDRIVAVVDDDVILESELENYVQNIRQQARRANQILPSGRELYDQALDRLIITRLQVIRAERAGIVLTNSQLTEAATDIAQRNGKTLRAFIVDLEREGVSYAQFRKDLEEEIVTQQLRARQVESRVNVSDQEVADAMLVARSSAGTTQYQINHIMITSPRDASAEIAAAREAKINDIKERLQNGADFAQTAVAFSEGQRALEGGNLGWRTLNDMPTIFVEPIKDLAIGNISEVIRSPSGFHIIQLGNTRNPNERSVQELKLRHILVKPTAVRTMDDAYQQLVEIRQKIAAGEDFSDLAKTFSDDPGSANKGGDLGWVKPGVMVPPFEAAAKALEQGEVSAPVQTRFGWHLILTEGRRERDVSTEILEANVRQQIYQRKLAEETDAWARELRDRSYVEVRL